MIIHKQTSIHAGKQTKPQKKDELCHKQRCNLVQGNEKSLMKFVVVSQKC